MTPEEPFTAALGLGRQRRVAECRFEAEPKRLELRIEHVPGEHFECPRCKALCGVHDIIERRWRHLNFFHCRCELVTRVPLTWCRTDGVRQMEGPWARQGSGGWKRFISLAKSLPPSAGFPGQHGCTTATWTLTDALSTLELPLAECQHL
jgi:hypothetical protein